MSIDNARFRVLFVCIENAGRSQMAEALTKLYAGDSVEPYSAGSRASGTINPDAVTAMKELGYDLSTHKSKSLREIPDVEYDAVVTMGCGDECPFVRAKRHFDWNIVDTRGKGIDDVREIRDSIATHVSEFVRTFNLEQTPK